MKRSRELETTTWYVFVSNLVSKQVTKGFVCKPRKINVSVTNKLKEKVNKLREGG